MVIQGISVESRMRTPLAFVIAFTTCFPSFGAEQSSVGSEDKADDRVEEVVVTGEPVGPWQTTRVRVPQARLR